MTCDRNPEDSGLFEQEMADVEPLEHDSHVPEISFRQPVSISEREREALSELDRIVSGDAPFDMRDSDEYIEGRVPGLDPRVVKRLHKGEFSIQADLDLHGVDSKTARSLVERLIEDAWERGLRCVRIVHGHGRNSPGGTPVLKLGLPRWLARGRARSAVLAYTSASPKDGGAGATYVLLRARRSRPVRRDPL